MMLNLINTIQGWKKSLLIISLIPILLLGFLFISYGIVFNSFIDENSVIDFFKLPYLFSLFSTDIELPIIVKIIGRICNILFYGIFTLWVILFTLISYLKLSMQIGSKIELLIELAIISIIYFFIVSPMSILFYLLGFLVVVFNLGLIVLYWIYGLKAER